MFPNLLHITRKTTNKYLPGKTPLRNSRIQSEAEAPPVPQGTRESTLEGLTGGLHADHIAPPPDWCRTILRDLPSTYDSFSGKRAYKVDIQLP